MDKWPERKLLPAFPSRSEVFEAETWNACHDAFMAVINAGEEEELTREKWMEIIMPYHGGNPQSWAESMDRIYTDYFDPKSHKGIAKRAASPTTPPVTLALDEKELHDLWNSFDTDIHVGVRVCKFIDAICTRLHTTKQGTVGLDEDDFEKYHKIDCSFWNVECEPCTCGLNKLLSKFHTRPVELPNENEILQVIINHMGWNQEGFPLSVNDIHFIVSGVEKGVPKQTTSININQVELATAIRKMIEEKGKT